MQPTEVQPGRGAVELDVAEDGEFWAGERVKLAHHSARDDIVRLSAPARDG